MTRVIARHTTRNNWSVAVIFKGVEKGVTRKDHFEIARVNDEGTYLVMNRVFTEADARKAANELWLRDMGRGPKMIGYGGPAI